MSGQEDVELGGSKEDALGQKKVWKGKLLVLTNERLRSEVETKVSLIFDNRIEEVEKIIVAEETHP